MIGAWDPGLDVQRYGRGLEGLIVGDTAVSEIDGSLGILRYRGYPIEELAEHASFEEVSYLVLHGELPVGAELAEWRGELQRWRQAPVAALAALERLPAGAHPLAKHRTMLTVAACEAPSLTGLAEPARLLGWSATLAAAAIRHLRGLPPIAPHADLGYAACFLQMTLGRAATPEEERAFEVSLIVQAEHGLHAAALAALVVISTGADLGSALLAGMGALSGVRHGGANQLAFELLDGLADPEAARRQAREAIASRERIPGFGHRVYKCPDPRVRVLEPHAEALCRARGYEERWQTYRAFRDEVEGALGARGIYGNVDGITGLVYHPLGLPASAFPIPFCLAIQTGWIAHCLEYRQSAGKMIEPGAVYVADERAR